MFFLSALPLGGFFSVKTGVNAVIKMKEKSVRASSKGIGLKLIETAKDRVVRVIGIDHIMRVIGIGHIMKVIGTDHIMRVIGTGREAKATVSMPNALIMITGCGI